MEPGKEFSFYCIMNSESTITTSSLYIFFNFLKQSAYDGYLFKVLTLFSYRSLFIVPNCKLDFPLSFLGVAGKVFWVLK